VGNDYSGLTSAPNKRDFSGAIAVSGGPAFSSDPSRRGAVSGSFFASPTSPIAGQGGSFTINGTGYSAAGTFAGERQ